MQLSEPADVLYVPLMHSVHGPPSGPVKPGLHWQRLAFEPEVVFAPQTVHASGPFEALNLPARQSTQTPVSPPVPESHLIEQSSCELLPASEKGMAEGQSWQVLESICPINLSVTVSI